MWIHLTIKIPFHCDVYFHYRGNLWNYIEALTSVRMIVTNNRWVSMRHEYVSQNYLSEHMQVCSCAVFTRSRWDHVCVNADCSLYTVYINRSITSLLRFCFTYLFTFLSYLLTLAAIRVSEYSTAMTETHRRHPLYAHFTVYKQYGFEGCLCLSVWITK